MYLTGFADEAANGIDEQIRATKELGWRNIESRNVDGENLHDISDEKFKLVRAKLDEAGVQVNCFGSAIANSGTPITQPFEVSLEKTRRAIDRMRQLGTKLLRIMSYGILRDREPDDQEEQERFRRLREMVKMFTDAGLQPVHENCLNYGGMGWQFTLKLLENVPGLKLVFDTCNAVITYDYMQPKPWPKQTSWEFYEHVKEHVAYVHVKDARYVRETDGIFAEAEYLWPGEGDADVKRILKDLLDGGYDGGISIEPHLAVVYHDKSVQSSEEVMYQNYVEYGRRMMALLEEIGHPCAGGAAE